MAIDQTWTGAGNAFVLAKLLSNLDSFDHIIIYADLALLSELNPWRLQYERECSVESDGLVAPRRRATVGRALLYNLAASAIR